MHGCNGNIKEDNTVKRKHEIQQLSRLVLQTLVGNRRMKLIGVAIRGCIRAYCCDHSVLFPVLKAYIVQKIL